MVIFLKTELCENPEKEYEDYMNDEFIGGLLQKFTDSTNSDEVVYSIFQIIAEIAKTGDIFSP